MQYLHVAYRSFYSFYLASVRPCDGCRGPMTTRIAFRDSSLCPDCYISLCRNLLWGARPAYCAACQHPIAIGERAVALLGSVYCVECASKSGAAVSGRRDERNAER